jgi:hypothetical protein
MATKHSQPVVSQLYQANTILFKEVKEEWKEEEEERIKLGTNLCDGFDVA